MGIKRILVVLSLFFAGNLLSSVHPSAYAAHVVRNLNVFAVEINGVKFWLPSTLIVKKGETVKIHAVSKIQDPNATHGFAIDEFKVEALVDHKGKDIEFVANKSGIFQIRCQLHPAHVGGQLLVLD